MIEPLLSKIIASQFYEELDHAWRVPDPSVFAYGKTLYDYQQEALQAAAKALHMYYGAANPWQEGETIREINARKEALAEIYTQHQANWSERFHIRRRKNKRDREVFAILNSKFHARHGTRFDMIEYWNLINRMCFWMATGSGKTLVMIKLIEYLHHLKKQGLIPPHNIMLLAPSDLVLRQIRQMVDDFNKRGKTPYIEMAPLRARKRGLTFGDVERVYYERSDNISDVQKELRWKYDYHDNEGRCYVVLDEAHKGGQGESKRQAYYALLARNGFLFNFSATFTDEQDIATTAYQFNLSNFINRGYGKHLLLSRANFPARQKEEVDFTRAAKRKTLLQSLVTLALIIQNYEKLKEAVGDQDIYHRPLMMTLVNSVGTEEKKNDLLDFFRHLQDLAAKELDEKEFSAVKKDLKREWGTAEYLFEKEEERLLEDTAPLLNEMSLADFRRAIFLTETPGSFEVLYVKKEKEIAFQLKTADNPFALIRIGDISDWKKNFLRGYEEGVTLGSSYFDNMDQFTGSILMGSRSFFESWDSNRPNVINFINIARIGAKKFTTQSIGRGVRIQPYGSWRRRLKHIEDLDQQKEHARLTKNSVYVDALETLFIYATDRDAVKNILDRLRTEEEKGFVELAEGVFRRSQLPLINDEEIPLLIPYYAQRARPSIQDLSRENICFEASQNSWRRYKDYLGQASDGLLIVGGLTPDMVRKMRAIVTEDEHHFRANENRNYGDLGLLESGLTRYIQHQPSYVDKVDDMPEDKIVHFKHVRTNLPDRERQELEQKMRRVVYSLEAEESEDDLLNKLQDGKITKDQFYQRRKPMEREGDEQHREMDIKTLAQHYYNPLLINSSDEKRLSYIKHIIHAESERTFIQKLTNYIAHGEDTQWDGWMFSKLDEAVDDIYIPYFDSKINEARVFKPDFIFWMCDSKKRVYRIVFVDPKSSTYANWTRKVDGYCNLFEPKRRLKNFNYENRNKKWKVHVLLFMFSAEPVGADPYEKYWTGDVGKIFGKDHL